jgi:hypothetical protein
MEKDLFGPIKKYFEKDGYICDGEVGEIDLYMERGEEKIAVELKNELNFRVLQQAALRQKLFDTVYIGTFSPKNMRSSAFRDKLYLLKRLGIGLIIVSKRSGQVQIINEPVVSELSSFQKRNAGKKKAISKEFNKRRTKNNTGGVRGEKLITSFREDALLGLDAAAELGGRAKSIEIKKLSGIDRATNIMYRNAYGWFERIGDGIYGVTDQGYAALEEFEDTVYILKRGPGK